MVIFGVLADETGNSNFSGVSSDWLDLPYIK